MKDSTNTGLIGVIVPVYKTEKYIAECIESILAQTYTKFRLILVDDGSPDGAGAICEQYAAKDNRITVIHQKNAGVTRARARGVEEASDCEWITFVDSDDTIIPDALVFLISQTRTYSTDIVICNARHDSSKSIYKNKFIDKDTYIYRIITEDLCSIWGKLFRKSLFNSGTFKIPRYLSIGEDLIMNLNLAYNTDSNIILINDKKIYSYNHRPNSTINTFKPSIEYEIMLNDYITKVVMQNSDLKRIFAHALIKRRLLWWNRLFGYHSSTPKWYGTPYHQQLKNDIKRFEYPIGLIELKLIEEGNTTKRYCLIQIRKVFNKISSIIDTIQNVFKGKST